MPLHSSAWLVTSVPFTFLHIIIVSYLTFTIIIFMIWNYLCFCQHTSEWLLWVAKYCFELCSDLVIPPLKILYNLYYVTVVNTTETETVSIVFLHYSTQGPILHDKNLTAYVIIQSISRTVMKTWALCVLLMIVAPSSWIIKIIITLFLGEMFYGPFGALRMH